MSRKLALYGCALVAVLLLCGDASACGKRRGGGCSGVVVYSGCSGYAAPSYAQPAPQMAYAGGYVAAPTYSTAPAYGYTSAPAYGYGGYGYGYNPGGLGGPRSGLGVRPGPGFGGLGPRR